MFAECRHLDAELALTARSLSLHLQHDGTDQAALLDDVGGFYQNLINCVHMCLILFVLLATATDDILPRVKQPHLVCIPGEKQNA